MNRHDQSMDDREEYKSVPMRTIDDAVYGHPPTSRVGRHVVGAKRWFQLDANRWLIAGILLSGSFFIEFYTPADQSSERNISEL